MKTVYTDQNEIVLQIIRLVHISIIRKRDYVHSYRSNNSKTSDQDCHSILIVILKKI